MSEPERPDRCAVCRFWVPRWEPEKGDLEEDADGTCHRRAPCSWNPAPGEDTGDRYAWWPLTFAVEFCGEWQPLPVVQRQDVPPPAGG